MAKFFGYDGDESEDALKAALREDFAAEQMDALEKVRTKYMRDGHIIDIAIQRGYTQRLGLKGWLASNVGCGTTHASECQRCWKERAAFDQVAAWWRSGNHDFEPSKQSGPRFYLELLQAWRDRGKSDADKKKRKGKKLGLKEMRQLCEAYRSFLDRVGGEHVRWAQEDNRVPLVWNQITQERATVEAQLSESGGDDGLLPLTATRPLSAEEPDEHVSEPEQEQPHPGAVAVSGRTAELSGHGFVMIDQVVATRRTPRPPKPMLPLAHNTESTVKRPMQIAHPLDTPMTAERLAETEMSWNLKSWAGKRAADDTKVRCRRAAFFGLHPKMTPEDAKWLSKQNRDFWRSADDDTTVLGRLAQKGVGEGA